MELLSDEQTFAYNSQAIKEGPQASGNAEIGPGDPDSRL